MQLRCWSKEIGTRIIPKAMFHSVKTCLAEAWLEKLYKGHKTAFLLLYLVGLAVVQVPELDVPVPDGYKVGAVLRERHTCHLTGHLVCSHYYILLQENKKTTCFWQIPAKTSNLISSWMFYFTYSMCTSTLQSCSRTLKMKTVSSKLA